MVSVAGILLVVIPVWFSNWIGGRMTLFTSTFWRIRHVPDLSGKTAIVTGANTGIGYTTARELARKGAKVIVAARSEERGKDAVARIKKQLKGLKGADLVEFMKLDLGSFSQIRSFARSFLWNNRQLDILVLNAGIMVPPFETTKDGFESQIGVNHLGHFLLTKLLTPLLKKSKARVVSVSSLAHIGPYPGGIKFDTFRNGTGYNAVAACENCYRTFYSNLCRIPFNPYPTYRHPHLLSPSSSSSPSHTHHHHHRWPIKTGQHSILQRVCTPYGV